MGAQKKRFAIDAIASLVHKIEQVWQEKKLAAALFLDVKKGAYDYAVRNQLISRMLDLEIDGDLIWWTRLFLTERKLQLVIDGNTNQEEEIEPRIP